MEKFRLRLSVIIIQSVLLCKALIASLQSVQRLVMERSLFYQSQPLTDQSAGTIIKINIFMRWNTKASI